MYIICFHKDDDDEHKHKVFVLLKEYEPTPLKYWKNSQISQKFHNVTL